MTIKRIIATACAAITLILLSETAAAQIADTADQGIKVEDLSLILKIFDGQQPKEVIPRADILVETTEGEADKAATAEAIYDYYRNSRIMGYDEIAISFADKYFLSGKFKASSEEKLLEMKLFSEFNRRSLVGMKGEDLLLQDPSGRNISILNGNQDYTILYFYDDECPNCRKTTPALLQFLMQKSDVKYTLYMIYTQSDRERWMNYIKSTSALMTLPGNVKNIHLWDPEMKSDFPMKYGVISTPQLMLLDREGTIIGRGLTPAALAQLVDLKQNEMNGLEILLEQIFRPIAAESDTTRITKEIDTFFNDSKDNPEFFHELFYTMYQYLKGSPYYSLQQGAAYLAHRYIAGMPELWKSVQFVDTGVTKGSVIRAGYQTPDEFLEETRIGVEMFYRNMLGKPVCDLTLKDSRNKETHLYDTDAEYTVLYFYSLDCKVCDAVTPAIYDLYERFREKGVETIAIYTGTDKKWKKTVKENGRLWTELWDRNHESGMFQKYDLMDVPAIYLLDKEKNVLAKDINPDVLEELLNYYLPKEE